MATDYQKLRTLRPSSVQDIQYTETPSYYKHPAYDDRLAILVCQIKIWEADEENWFKIPSADSSNCLTLRECESIEVTESAKDLIGKAVVKFPRGTVIHKSSKKDGKVNIGDDSNGTHSETTLKKATNDGEVISTVSSTYADNGVSITSIAPGYDDKGLIDFNRSKTETALLSSNDIAIGQRIEIRLGYAYSEKEFNQMNTADSDPDLDIVFTGFITSISVDTPLELECTNMAHILASISAPKIQAAPTVKVKDFLDPGGKYDLLRGTGISLAKSSQGCELTVLGGSISNNVSVADVLSDWSKKGVLCVLETKRNGTDDGSVELKVGLAYSAGKNGGKLPNNDKNYITYNGGYNTIKLLQFDWDVAHDKLGLKRCDKKYVAIEATGTYTDVEHGKSVVKFLKLTVRKNPDNDDEGWLTDDNEFQVVNKREMSKSKITKHRDGTRSVKRIKGSLTDRVSLDKYEVIPYHSLTHNITQQQLIEEAKQFWSQISPNGISGSIEIFGDVFVKPTDIVGLIDPRQPHKNGYYYVESVHTTFGLDGYRRELEMPFKLANFAQPVKII